MSLDNLNKNDFVFFDSKYNNENIVPDDLYHYTDANAIINIIPKSILRFTCINCFDDKQEYRYVYKLILKNIIPKFKKRLDENNLLEFLKNRCKAIIQDKIYYENEAENYSNYFVSCFSIDQNSKKMWKEYAKRKNNIGYQFHIKTSDLYECIENDFGNKYLFAKVCYDRKKQIKILEDIFDKYIYFYDEKRDMYNDYRKLFNNIIMCCLFFKDKKYSFENEVRFIVIRDTQELINKFPTKIINKNSIISTCIDWNFDKEGYCLVKSINLSKSKYNQYAIYGIRQLADYCKFIDIEVVDI